MYNHGWFFYLHANDNGNNSPYQWGYRSGYRRVVVIMGHSNVGYVVPRQLFVEIAWQQGDDLYSALDNRLMKGFEYVANIIWGIMFL